ncbi:hypothetical protein E2542_SST00606 [Spatholobus suberectus]|nr:hypothetical protein E2542_SST00606 [Spatholobus suberectus]
MAGTGAGNRSKKNSFNAYELTRNELLINHSRVAFPAWGGSWDGALGKGTEKQRWVNLVSVFVCTKMKLSAF